MGCASSKKLENGFSTKGISMPRHAHSLPADLHFVALTDSTYGLLNIDPPIDEQGSRKVECLKEMLNKLNTIENGPHKVPQSWLEVRDLLQDLKPALEKSSARETKNKMPGSNEVKRIMTDLHEDVPNNIFPAPASVPVKKSFKPFHACKAIPIHTLAELEACLNVNEGDKLAKCSDEGDDRDDLAEQQTALFDADLLDFYQKVPNYLSEDDLKTVDALAKAPSQVHEVQKTPKEGATGDRYTPLHPKTSTGEIEHGPQSTSLEVRRNGYVPHNFKSSQKTVRQIVHGVRQIVHGDGLPQYSPRINTKTMHSPKSPQTKARLFEGEEGSYEVSNKSTTEQDHAARSAKCSHNILDQFEIRCPPGGNNSAVLYTTSLRGIRKTYDDCNNVRDILQGLGIAIDERDVSMHLEYRNELKELMETMVSVPRLFVKGRYVGGVEDIMNMHQDGKLDELLKGIPAARSVGKLCDGCGGARFVPCFECSGSCKVVSAGKVSRCADCNENGLIRCPICS